MTHIIDSTLREGMRLFADEGVGLGASVRG